jgi:hypothetical protein
VLFIGASADSRWTAGELDQVTTDSYLNWSSTFSIPAGSPPISVEFDSTSRNLWLLGQLIVVLTLVLVALPSRQRFDVDVDAEALAALAAPEGRTP